MRALLLATLATAVLAGCGASRFSREGGGVRPLAAHAVEWNPAHADVGPVRAVADSGDLTVVFGDGQATVLVAGAVVAVDHAVARWTGAGTIPAADGNGAWIVGLDGDGRVLRLRDRSRFEPVSDRWGLAKDHVREVAAFGPSSVSFLLDGELAVADGREVTRYAVGAIDGFGAGGGRAALGGDPLRIFEPQRRAARAFTLPARAERLAVGGDGRLVAATSEAIYAEDERGDLALRFEAAGPSIHGLAAAGPRVWFAEGAELGTLEGGVVRATTGGKLAAQARLVGSPSGDVWAIDGERTLLRFAAGAGAADAWAESLSPIFQRACSECHLAGGSAGVNLASAGAFHAQRDALRRRVIVERSMPPPGHALSDADRATIDRWLSGPAEPF